MVASKNVSAVAGIEGDPIYPPSYEENGTTPLLKAHLQAESTGPRKQPWAGSEDFEDFPWWRRPSVFWLLGPFFLFTLAFGGSIVPKINLIVDLICQRKFADETLKNPNFTYIPVTLGIDNPQCFIPEVKRSVSMFTMAINLTTGILSAVTAPKLGHLSDRFGRTKLLAFTSCGGCISEIIFIICATYPESIHYNWLILAATFDGLAGSFTAGTILSNSYTSDCTPPSRRGVAIGYIHACLFSGLAFGPLLASFVVTATGSLLSVFYVTLGCHIFFVLFVGFVVPESLSKKRQEKAQNKYADELETSTGSHNAWLPWVHIANLLVPLKALWPTRPGSSPALRRNITAFAYSDMIFLGASASAGSVILLYCESPETWGWGTPEASRFMSAVSFVRVLILLVILPAINYWFRTRPAARRTRETGVVPLDTNAGADNVDLWLLRVALCSDVLGSIGYMLARRVDIFVASGLLTALGGMGSATVQAAITKHVPAEEVGKVLGAIGLLHALSRVGGPIAFNSLYYATVGKFDQAIFALLVGLYGSALLSSMLIRPHVYMKHVDNHQDESSPLLGSREPNDATAADEVAR